MKIKNQFLSLIVLSLLVFFTSCNKDEVVDQEPKPQAEVISKGSSLVNDRRYDKFIDAYNDVIARYEEIKNTPAELKDNLSATIMIENKTPFDLVVSKIAGGDPVFRNTGGAIAPFSNGIYEDENGNKIIFKAGTTIAILVREGSRSLKAAISFETQNSDPNVDKVHWNIGYDLTNFDRTSTPFNRNSAIVHQSLDLAGHELYPTHSSLNDSRLYINSDNLLRCEAFVGRQTEKLGYLRFTLSLEQI
ncbi:hypothetical protein ABW636_09640 [Aquimarina sp. 2201CG1-2-11]|uniref:hypothetical protein n=1 Tax=Aquimarina discodermiae TaxID=3231043 RepID=UPI0034628A52